MFAGRHAVDIAIDSKREVETGVLAHRSRSIQTVHYASVGFLIACLIWAAAMVLYKLSHSSGVRLVYYGHVRPGKTTAAITRRR
jgi:hypothetical protein